MEKEKYIPQNIRRNREGEKALGYEDIYGCKCTGMSGSLQWNYASGYCSLWNTAKKVFASRRLLDVVFLVSFLLWDKNE